MPWIGNEYIPTVEEARAEIHSQLDRWFGEEYDDLKEMLDDLVAAVKREVTMKDILG